MKQLARKSALSHKAKDLAIKIVEDFSFHAPKTKEMISILKALELANTKTLLVVPATDQIVWKSGRNLRKLHIIEANKASTYEILNSQVLLIQKSALEVLVKTFS